MQIFHVSHLPEYCPGLWGRGGGFPKRPIKNLGRWLIMRMGGRCRIVEARAESVLAPHPSAFQSSSRVLQDFPLWDVHQVQLAGELSSFSLDGVTCKLASLHQYECGAGLCRGKRLNIKGCIHSCEIHFPSAKQKHFYTKQNGAQCPSLAVK